MKIVLSESQYKRLIETEEEEQEVIEIPNLKIFGKRNGIAWMRLQELLEKRGNPPYSIGGDLRLYGEPIKSLGNLVFVGGDVDLRGTEIESLGKLKTVEGHLDLEGTPIESLGNLKSVGWSLNLYDTPISKKYSEEEIRQMVNVGEKILL